MPDSGRPLDPTRGPLLRISGFAAILSAAGLPLYVHLPLFALRDLGLSLQTTGFVLLVLRVFDFVQDPLLGRLVDRFPDRGRALATAALLAMGLGFGLLFSVPAPIAAVWWLVICLVLIFTGYSLASILFYARGVALAARLGGHLRVASFRETGTLAGVLIATVTPSLLALTPIPAYAGFGVILSLMCLAGLSIAAPLWRGDMQRAPSPGLRQILTPAIRRFLLIGLLNGLPVAVTSTLFLLFVDLRLGLGDWSGAFLLLFFLSAGLAAPVWSALAARLGARPVLMSAMTLAILSFAGASQLGTGDGAAFAVICILSGATMSADIIILPALFSRSLSEGGGAGIGFGLWNFVTKLALALAAGGLALSEALGLAATTPGGAPDPAFLTLAYAVVPCGLKVIAILCVAALPRTEAVAQ